MFLFVCFCFTIRLFFLICSLVFSNSFGALLSIVARHKYSFECFSWISQVEEIGRDNGTNQTCYAWFHSEISFGKFPWLGFNCLTVVLLCYYSILKITIVMIWSIALVCIWLSRWWAFIGFVSWIAFLWISMRSTEGSRADELLRNIWYISKLENTGADAAFPLFPPSESLIANEHKISTLHTKTTLKRRSIPRRIWPLTTLPVGLLPSKHVHFL